MGVIEDKLKSIRQLEVTPKDIVTILASLLLLITIGTRNRLFALPWHRNISIDGF